MRPRPERACHSRAHLFAHEGLFEAVVLAWRLVRGGGRPSLEEGSRWASVIGLSGLALAGSYPDRAAKRLPMGARSEAEPGADFRPGCPRGGSFLLGVRWPGPEFSGFWVLGQPGPGSAAPRPVLGRVPPGGGLSWAPAQSRSRRPLAIRADVGGILGALIGENRVGGRSDCAFRVGSRACSAVDYARV